MWASCTASRALRQPAVLGSSRAPWSRPAASACASAPLSPACSVRFRPTVSTCDEDARIASHSTAGLG